MCSGPFHVRHQHQNGGDRVTGLSGSLECQIYDIHMAKCNGGDFIMYNGLYCVVHAFDGDFLYYSCVYSRHACVLLEARRPDVYTRERVNGVLRRPSALSACARPWSRAYTVAIYAGLHGKADSFIHMGAAIRQCSCPFYASRHLSHAVDSALDANVLDIDIDGRN